MPHSRSGYFKHWQDQHTLDGDASSAKQAHNQQDQDGDGGDDDDDENEPDAEVESRQEGGNDDDMLLDPALRSETAAMEKEATAEARRKAKGKAPAVPRESTVQIESDDEGRADASKREQQTGSNTIQILELESDRPIISYKGRVFEAEWAEVIGTEMLFVAHSDKDPLPALRNLAGDIDLLAASSARLITKEKLVKPRQPAHDDLAQAREGYGIHIPVGKDRSGERTAQARFLENLMALKKLRGETDDVTVYAQPGEGKDFDDTRAPDSRPRRRKPPASSDGGRRGRAASRTMGRGRVAARGGSRAASTPTPSHWEDLATVNNNDSGDDDDDEEEEEEHDDDDDDDVLMEG